MDEIITERPLIFGEVLYDHFPDGSEVLGGAPFNVAWNLDGLGLDPLMISRVGDDERGERILEAMRERGMDTVGMQVDREHATGTVEVSFQDGEPHYDIVDPRAYDFIDPAELPSVEGAALLYHGSLALRHETCRESLRRLREDSGAPVFVDVNLRAPWWSHDRLASMLQEASDLKLNEDELDRIASVDGGLEERVRRLRDRHPLRRVTITRGSAGAVAFDETGQRHDVTPAGGAEVVDTVGAGDAFSAVLIAGRLRRWEIVPTLQRAQALASAVVGRRGATVDDPDFYRSFAEAWNLS